MQSKSTLPEHDDPSATEGNLSQGNKRRRTSGRLTPNTSEQLETSNAAPTARRSMTRSSPQLASSREMTPAEGVPDMKYTRTGRVSKAAKGQRVHHCEDCGKTYTRAEHLRRHQQNHKPGAFPCDIPGCGRSFYREDLLSRHKARHNDPDDSVSGQLSPRSPQPTSDAEGAILHPTQPADERRSSAVVQPAPDQIIAFPDRTHYSTQSGAHQRTRKRNPNIDQSHRARSQPVLPVSVNGYPSYVSYELPWEDSSPPYSPAGYNTPNHDLSGPYFQPYPVRSRQHSSASYSGYHSSYPNSRSPISAGSSTIYLPQWNYGASDEPLKYLNASSGSERSLLPELGGYDGNLADPDLLPGNAEYRDIMERSELIVPTNISEGPSFDLSLTESTLVSEERYLTAYWTWIHPFFPVIHRTSFNLQDASPLLRAAMLALGAHSLGDATSKTNARIAHERCLKVLKKRTLNGWHTFRVCDMQAVFLVEAYAIFKSRRPPLQLSRSFEDIYQWLANDPEAVQSQVTAENSMYGLSSGSSGYFEDYSNNRFTSLSIQCKQRLLISCYLLDQQHATLFGRQRTACFANAADDLPFPRSQLWWDAVDEQQRVTLNENHFDNVSQVLDGLKLELSRTEMYDTFQSMLLLTSALDLANDPKHGAHTGSDLSGIFSAIENSPRISLATNAFQLCRLTPIRDLLAVAGESWVMAEKLGSQTEYTAAQIESRQWARGVTDPSLVFGMNESQPGANQPLEHALKILETHQNRPKTGLLFQEWAVYLASVVIWAKAYVNSTQSRRLSVPNPPQPRRSSYELEGALGRIIAGGAHGHIGLEEAMVILLWSKGKIEKVDIPHNCGLTNGALDVLGKLVTRGSEDGWFGS